MSIILCALIGAAIGRALAAAEFEITLGGALRALATAAVAILALQIPAVQDAALWAVMMPVNGFAGITGAVAEGFATGAELAPESP